jgi:hypothetical protein
VPPSPDPAGNPILIGPSIESGDRACIVMDDSSGGDHPDLDRGRRLWAGVALEPVTAQAIQRALLQLEMTNRTFTGSPVIHFTDLASGKGRYGNLKGEDRIGPIRSFSEIFLHFNPPVLIVQAAPSTITMLHAIGHRFIQLPGLDTTDPEGFALLTCLLALHKRTFEDVNYEGSLSVVADRWRGKESYVQPLLKAGRTVFNGLIPRGIAFMSVEDFPLLQVADFVAWSYSRLEITHARGLDALTNPYQREIFEILTQASRNWRTMRLYSDGNTELLTLAEAGL